MPDAVNARTTPSDLTTPNFPHTSTVPTATQRSS